MGKTDRMVCCPSWFHIAPPACRATPGNVSGSGLGPPRLPCECAPCRTICVCCCRFQLDICCCCRCGRPLHIPFTSRSCLLDGNPGMCFVPPCVPRNPSTDFPPTIPIVVLGRDRDPPPPKTPPPPASIWILIDPGVGPTMGTNSRRRPRERPPACCCCPCCWPPLLGLWPPPLDSDERPKLLCIVDVALSCGAELLICMVLALLLLPPPSPPPTNRSNPIFLA